MQAGIMYVWLHTASIFMISNLLFPLHVFMSVVMVLVEVEVLLAIELKTPLCHFSL